MYKVAVVDDEWESADRLNQCIEAYSKEFGEKFFVTRFKNGMDFLEKYKPVYDIVFMDVDMPYKNGLTIARELRKIDPTVVLVFVTVLAKYAIKGYEVDALDYVLKPVNYNAFKITIDRAIRRCAKKEKEEMFLPSVDGTMRIELSCLNYVEINAHDITYHTSQGNFRAYGTMRSIEKLLPANRFSKCNRSFLVNLRNVTRINGSYVYIGSEKLAISRTRKQKFMEAFYEYSISG